MAGWVRGLLIARSFPVSRNSCDEVQPTPKPIKLHIRIYLSKLQGLSDFNLMFAIMRMKVRRDMVVEIHTNDNPEKRLISGTGNSCDEIINQILVLPAVDQLQFVTHAQPCGSQFPTGRLSLSKPCPGDGSVLRQLSTALRLPQGFPCPVMRYAVFDYATGKIQCLRLSPWNEACKPVSHYKGALKGYRKQGNRGASKNPKIC